MLTWKASSYLASASEMEAVGGSMYHRCTATQRCQSSSAHTFIQPFEDCHTYGRHGANMSTNGF